jgi:hypothetical protein
MCLINVADGLREGLSHFSQPCRVAILFAVGPRDPIRIYDPLNLMRGHEPKLKELFVDNTAWREAAPDTGSMSYMETDDHPDYRLDGLISYCGRSRSIFFQLWFTEHHPDMCATGPTERWLEYAASLLSQNYSTENVLSIGTSGYVLQECATHAVRDYIVDQRNVLLGWDTHLRIFPVLDAVLGISKTLEEGIRPHGQMVFVEPAQVGPMTFMTRFPPLERPALKNFKHVRKLLQAVENSLRRLVSNGTHIIGISNGQTPAGSLIVDFRGHYGFLYLDRDLVCSFADGRFHSSTRKAKLVQVEEALLETDIDPTIRHELFQAVTQIVHHAGEGGFGCTLVVDFEPCPVEIAGQKMEEPLDLRQPHLLDLAKSLARVDGALHLGADMKLHSFACLLDGRSVPGEDRARGARFNSALRFSADHPDLIVIVVSADHPVSAIQGGLELTATCEWMPVSGALAKPPALDDWLQG